MSRRPLDGVLVADFSWYGAGPIAAQYLCAMGAEVVRVESEAKMDNLRKVQPFAMNPDGSFISSFNASGYYNNCNAGKESVLLNLNTEKGQEVGRRIIAKADIFVSNFTPRVIAKWNLTWETLSALNPGLIAMYTSMMGFAGPYRDFLGFGSVLTPITGFNNLSGFPKDPPIGGGTNYPDYVINPGHSIVAILAALRVRRRTGKGQQIEMPQIESVVNVLGSALPEYLSNGTNATRDGNRSPIASPHGVFCCADDPTSVDSPDRWVAIACRDDGEWQRAAEALGEADAARDARFATFAQRKAHEDALEALVGAWIAGRRAEDVMAALQAVGVPAGVVQNAQDILDKDPHLAARGFYQYLDHAEIGRTAYDGVPARLSRTPAYHAAPAPLLGEHTFDVCTRIAGFSGDEVAELMAEGVLA